MVNLKRKSEDNRADIHTDVNPDITTDMNAYNKVYIQKRHLGKHQKQQIFENIQNFDLQKTWKPGKLENLTYEPC